MSNWNKETITMNAIVIWIYKVKLKGFFILQQRTGNRILYNDSVIRHVQPFIISFAGISIRA